MDIEIKQTGFEGRGFKVRPAGLFSGPRLIIDGVIIKGKHGRYEVRDNSGTGVTIKLKPSFLDPVPQLDIDGGRVVLSRPLTWNEYIWIGLPLILIFSGGALGGGIGFGAAYSSARIFRSDRSIPVKYLLTCLISIGATAIFFVLAFLLHSLMKGSGICQ
jgi:hypothetical protein